MTGPDPLLCEILLGLASTPKVLPPALFYDERGSVLFEEITGAWRQLQSPTDDNYISPFLSFALC